MSDFPVGDHVRWNSGGASVIGVIVKKHMRDVEYHGQVRHCTVQDPQYEIKSDKADHVAMYKTNALTKVN